MSARMIARRRRGAAAGGGTGPNAVPVSTAPPVLPAELPVGTALALPVGQWNGPRGDGHGYAWRLFNGTTTLTTAASFTPTRAHRALAGLRLAVRPSFNGTPVPGSEEAESSNTMSVVPLIASAAGLPDVSIVSGAGFVVDAGADFTVRAGYTATFALAPASAALPTGASLDPATGEITGANITAQGTHNIVVRGSVSVGGVLLDWDDTAFTLVVAGALASIGFRAAQDEGPIADLYVAQATGSDATGTGTLANPFATIGRAVVAASLGQHIKALAGRYPEIVDLAAKQLTLSRYGTDVVTIHGGDVLGGWTACGPGDAPELGATLGAAGSDTYKVTVALNTLIDSDPRTANLHEAGVKMAPAMLWKTGVRRPHFIFAADQYLTFTAIQMQDTNPTTSTWVLGFTSAEVVAAYSAAQLLNAEMVGVEAPNAAFRKPVGSVVGDAIYMQGASAAGWANGFEELHLDAASGHANHFALVNLLPELKRGQWGYKVNGANVTFYVRPRNAANLASGIEIARRGQGVRLGSNTEVRGLRFKQHASGPDQANEKNPISMGGTGTKKVNVRVRNCLIENYTHVHFGYGAIWATNTDDSVFQDVTIRGMYGAFGWFLAGGNTPISALSRNNLVERMLVEGCEYSPYRLFCQRECLVTRCIAGRDCGVGSHANKANFYTTCHRCVFHACNFVGATGYLTWQRASAIAVIGCWVPCSYIGGDLRAIDDQNDPTDTPLPATSYGESRHSYVLCNALPPYGGYPLDPTGGASLLLGGAQALTYTVRGNILHGTSNTVGDGFVTEASHNVMTRGAAFGTDGAASSPGAVYADWKAGDHRYAAGSPVRTLALPDVSVEIAAVKAWLSSTLAAKIDVDLAGRAVDWTQGPIGPFTDYDDPMGVAAMWIDLPHLVNTGVVGVPLSVATGYRAGDLVAAETTQLMTSLDGVTWEARAGETDGSYTPTLEDVGLHLGWECRAGGPGGEVAFVQAPGPVTATYPVGRPVLALAAFDVGGTQDQGPEFAIEDRPCVLLVFDRNGQATAQTRTVTIGAPGRAYGSGVPAVAAGAATGHARNNAQMSAHLVTSPGAGQRTVQVQCAGSMNAKVLVLYVDDVATMTGGAETAGTTNALMPGRSTSLRGGLVLYAMVRAGAGATNLSLRRAELIAAGNTGGITAGDALWVAGYEHAAEPGSYNAVAELVGGSAASTVAAAWMLRAA